MSFPELLDLFLSNFDNFLGWQPKPRPERFDPAARHRVEFQHFTHYDPFFFICDMVKVQLENIPDKLVFELGLHMAFQHAVDPFFEKVMLNFAPDLLISFFLRSGECDPWVRTLIKQTCQWSGLVVLGKEKLLRKELVLCLQSLLYAFVWDRVLWLGSSCVAQSAFAFEKATSLLVLIRVWG